MVFRYPVNVINMFCFYMYCEPPYIRNDPSLKYMVGVTKGPRFGLVDGARQIDRAKRIRAQIYRVFRAYDLRWARCRAWVMVLYRRAAGTASPFESRDDRPPSAPY